MKQKPKELTIEEQLDEFSEIIVSLLLKSDFLKKLDENQNQETNITSTHQNSDKYP